ncbi:double zinc ribbon domain-containing protein [Methanospirillum stamsii]
MSGSDKSSGTKFCPQCGNEIMPKESGPRPSSHPPVQNSMSICPFCGSELRFAKTTKFCPYCKENIKPV